jgi:hypothetical protein
MKAITWAAEFSSAFGDALVVIGATAAPNLSDRPSR